MTTVVYIAGYGRSGSTVLDVLLDNHPQVIGTGELSHLFNEWVHDGTCSCGIPMSICPFWKRVISELRSESPGMSPGEALHVTRKVEKWSRSSTLSSALSPSRVRLYDDLWSKTIHSIARLNKQSIIVDSSKNSRGARSRLAHIAKLPGIKLLAVHLVRDPRAAMWSVLRGSNRMLEAARPARLRGGAYRGLVGWMLANAHVEAIRLRHPEIPFLRVRYEDLTETPISVLRVLGAFLDLDMQPLVDLIASGCSLRPGHGIAGNRTRRSPNMRLTFDDEWQTALPARARAAAMLAYPLARSYGYSYPSPR